MSSRKKSGLGRQAGALFPQSPPTDDLFSPTTPPTEFVPDEREVRPVAENRQNQPARQERSAPAAAARFESAVVPEQTLPDDLPAQAHALQTAVESAPRRPGRPPAPVGPEGPKKIKSTSLRVEEGLYKRFRQICLAKDVTVQVAIEEAIRNYIEGAERGE